MHIRFVKFTPHGNVQHLQGDLLNMPDDDLAQKHIADGNAIEVADAEYAVAPRANEFAVVPPSRPKKSTAKKAAARK